MFLFKIRKLPTSAKAVEVEYDCVTVSNEKNVVPHDLD